MPQNRALLDTLRLHQSSTNHWQGHICIYSTLLIGHTEHPGQMLVLSLQFVPKQMHRTYRQDMVFIRPPGISDGVFQLRMGNIWFCKLLLLFKISTMTDAGTKQHDCAFVSLLEEYTGPRKSVHILHTSHHLMCCSSQIGCTSVDPPLCTSAANSLKQCMAFQCPPYWDGFHLFLSVGPERFPLKCERESADFPKGLHAIKPRTVVTVVDGGTVVSSWDGFHLFLWIRLDRSPLKYEE